MDYRAGNYPWQQVIPPGLEAKLALQVLWNSPFYSRLMDAAKRGESVGFDWGTPASNTIMGWSPLKDGLLLVSSTREGLEEILEFLRQKEIKLPEG